MDIKETIIQRVQGIELCNPSVPVNTYEMTQRCLESGVPGDFVECGVFAGAQVAVMALVCDALPGDHSNRRVHLFDSFEGIPEAGPEDDSQPGIGRCTNGQGRLVSSGIAICSMEQCQAYMRKFGVNEDRLVYHKGWFQDTVPLWDGRPIALLRLDGDLYESTKVCLEYLYPYVSPGGIVIIDDYMLRGCRRAFEDYFQDNLPEFTFIEGTNNGSIWFTNSAARWKT